MSAIRNELAAWGRRLAERGLVAGTGGNVSARDGDLVWIKPSGGALAELAPREYVALDLAGGKQVRGGGRASSEAKMHLAIYRARSDVRAVFHTHSPWATGIASAGIEFRPLLIEVVGYLGDVVTLPYLLTSSRELADTVAAAARDHDTILMANHGVVVLAAGMRDAFQRCEVVEEAAKALVAASVAGRPRFLDAAQVAGLRALAKPARAE